MSDTGTLDRAQRQALVSAAIQATDAAFLTKPGGTRYGAAVLTSSGRIFRAGQYSSFNHVTNVHAEMAAIVLATMSGDPDITCLAIASTGAGQEPARPCGVCREFINEHGARIGRDIIVLMTNRDGSVVEETPLSRLLPDRWSPASRKAPDPGPDWARYLRPADALGRPLDFGDLVQTRGRFLSLVWIPQWLPGIALVKVKYDADGPKFPHSFSQYDAYCNRLSDLGLQSSVPWGVACLVNHDEIEGVVPAQPLHQGGLAAMRPLLDVLTEARIGLDRASLTASRACGLFGPDSDFDVVLRVDTGELGRLRSVLHRELEGDVLEPPVRSGTWDSLCETGKRPEQLVAEGRFLETFGFKGGLKCSLIYTPPKVRAPLFDRPPQAEPAMCVQGRVVDATEVSYKGASYLVQDEVEEQHRFFCLHKLAGLLRKGDEVLACGVPCAGPDRRVLLQVDPVRHFLRWPRWREAER